MDPNETLQQLREDIGKARSADRQGQRHEFAGELHAANNAYATASDYYKDAAERASALDAWMASGGFPPDEWDHWTKDDDK